MGTGSFLIRYSIGHVKLGFGSFKEENHMVDLGVGDRGSCATNRKVAGSIPAGVSGFFIDIKTF